MPLAFSLLKSKEFCISSMPTAQKNCYLRDGFSLYFHDFLSIYSAYSVYSVIRIATEDPLFWSGDENSSYISAMEKTCVPQASHMADHFYVAKWFRLWTSNPTLSLCCCLLALQISACWTIPYMVNAAKGAGGQITRRHSHLSQPSPMMISAWLHLQRRISGSSLWLDNKALVCAIVKGKSQF